MFYRGWCNYGQRKYDKMIEVNKCCGLKMQTQHRYKKLHFY